MELVQNLSDPADQIIFLVVEDEALIRWAFAEVLRDLGVQVVEVGTADEAWAYLQSEPSLDLVVTDHRMPGTLTGAQLVELIHEKYPHIQTVIVSAHYHATSPSTTVIQKPFDFEELARKLVMRVTKQKYGRSS